MKGGLRRAAAVLVCDILQLGMPAHLRSWGSAIRYEVSAIDDDGAALSFAFGSLCGVAPRVLAFHLIRSFVALSGGAGSSPGAKTDMGMYHDMARHPRAIGIACAIGAVVLGLAHMAAAGAPIAYLGVNSGALILGLAILAVVGRAAAGDSVWPGASTLAMAAVLLATALLGNHVGGAVRWVRLGGLFVQPSLILLPLMVVGFSRSRDWLSTTGIIVAATALALQPDRAMAGSLAAGLTILAVMRPDRKVVVALVGSLVALLITAIRADTLRAMPYVEHVVYSAFGVNALVGLAVLAGLILLLIPAMIGAFDDGDDRRVHAVFGAVWLAVIAAAALGNYPTPVVGYSGAAVLGYVISLAALPRTARSNRRTGAALDPNDRTLPSYHRLRIGTACAA